MRPFGADQYIPQVSTLLKIKIPLMLFLKVHIRQLNWDTYLTLEETRRYRYEITRITLQYGQITSLTKYTYNEIGK